MSKRLVNCMVIALTAIITLSVILAVCYQTKVGQIYGQGIILPGSILSSVNENGSVYYSAIGPNRLYYERLYFIELSQVYWLIGLTLFNTLSTIILLTVLNEKVLWE